MTYNKANPVIGTDTPDSVRTYLIGDDVIAQTVDGVTDYLLYDGHGSTRQLAEYDSVNDTVSITETYSYDAYGVLLQDEDNFPPTGTQTPGYTPAQATNLLYAGEYFNIDAQQYYLRARYYDPLNGRFNQTDPFAGSPQDPQSLHKYLYCHANPINGIDPGGLEFTLTHLVVTTAIMTILFNIVISGFVGYNLGKAMGEGNILPEGVAINIGLAGGAYGFAAAVVLSLIYYWNTNDLYLMVTGEFGTSPLTAFSTTRKISLLGTIGFIFNSDSVYDLEGFGFTATWPTVFARIGIPSPFNRSKLFSKLLHLAKYNKGTSIKNRSGVIQLTQSASGAVMIAGGFWSYSFGTQVGFSKIWQLADFDKLGLPDKVKDVIGGLKSRITSINENSSEEEMTSLIDSIE